jgi:hypothetical protein
MGFNQSMTNIFSHVSNHQNPQWNRSRAPANIYIYIERERTQKEFRSGGRCSWATRVRVAAENPPGCRGRAEGIELAPAGGSNKMCLTASSRVRAGGGRAYVAAPVGDATMGGGSGSPTGRRGCGRVEDVWGEGARWADRQSSNVSVRTWAWER